MVRIEKVLFSLVCIVFFLTCSSISKAQIKDEIEVDGQEVSYELPYPGILPDHPLYFLKSARDSIRLFFTRDNLKKAKLLLLYSDKKIAMAQPLSNAGRWDLSSKIILEAEEDFEDTIEALKTSKKLGVSPTADDVQKAILSNQKHREIIENLLSKTPQGERSNLEKAFKLNKKLEEDINDI